jgi:rubrerythrin
MEPGHRGLADASRERRITVGEKGFDALRVLELAEDLERRGQAFYKEAAEAVSDETVKSMLLTLADAEGRHLQLIESIRKGLEKAFPIPSQREDVSNLAARFEQILFPEAPSAILSDTSKLTEIQVLERGRQLEEESIKLYEDAAEKESNPGASNAFRRLVMEERMHLFILDRRLDLLKLQSQGA